MNVLVKKSNYDTTQHWWCHFRGQCNRSSNHPKAKRHSQTNENKHIRWLGLRASMCGGLPLLDLPGWAPGPPPVYRVAGECQRPHAPPPWLVKLQGSNNQVLGVLSWCAYPSYMANPDVGIHGSEANHEGWDTCERETKQWVDEETTGQPEPHMTSYGNPFLTTHGTSKASTPTTWLSMVLRLDATCPARVWI